jgi:hypothetical protein
MGQAQDWEKMGVGGVESINNLDTARMTLRWALERLRAFEEKNNAFEKKIKEFGDIKEKLEEERSALKRALSVRDEEEKWRDDYYQRQRQRIQDLISERLSGNASASTLAARELELAKLEEENHQRRLALEKEYSAKIRASQSEYERLKRSLDEQAKNQAEQWEKAEAERQIRFNEFMTQQRNLLEMQSRQVEAESARVSSWRLEQAAESWAKEKESLLKEIAQLKQAQGELRRSLEHERRALDAAREESLNISRSAEIRLRSLEEERKIFEKDKEAIKTESNLWRLKSGEAMSVVSELKKKTVELENQLKEVQALLSEEAAKRKAAEEKFQVYEKSWSKRQTDLDLIEESLLKKFKDLEDEVARRDRVWKDREEFMRKRDQNWHNRIEEWQSMMQEKSEGVEKLRGELLEAVRGYIKRKKGDKYGNGEFGEFRGVSESSPEA